MNVSLPFLYIHVEVDVCDLEMEKGYFLQTYRVGTVKYGKIQDGELL